MGTTSSFFGGSGGATAIPNISYDLIRKSTYKSVLTIDIKKTYAYFIPYSDTQFVAYSGNNNDPLTMGHYTIGSDGSLTQDLAPTTLGFNNQSRGGVGNSNGHFLIASSNSSTDYRMDKVVWNGSSFALTNITNVASGSIKHLCFTSMYSGYMLGAHKRTDGSNMQCAGIDPNGNTISASLSDSTKYGDNDQVGCCGTADGLAFIGRHADGQSVTDYAIGSQYIHLGSVSNNTFAIGSQTRDTAHPNSTFQQISAIAIHPAKQGGAYWYASDSNGSIATGMLFSKGMASYTARQSDLRHNSTTLAKTYMTNSDYGNFRHCNGTVVDGDKGSILAVDENTQVGMPNAFAKVGIKNVNSQNIEDGQCRVIQVGKYLVVAAPVASLDKMVLNVYEVE